MRSTILFLLILCCYNSIAGVYEYTLMAFRQGLSTNSTSSGRGLFCNQYFITEPELASHGGALQYVTSYIEEKAKSPK